VLGAEVGSEDLGIEGAEASLIEPAAPVSGTQESPREGALRAPLPHRRQEEEGVRGEGGLVEEVLEEGRAALAVEV
jgi:hypothetical protein